MGEVGLFLGILAFVFVGWLLSEFWQIILPVIGAIIVLVIIIHIIIKKQEKNTEKKYINHPEVKKELDECFERVKMLHSACLHNSGYIIISEKNFGILNYSESEYMHDIPRVSAKIELIGSYPLEVYKNACYTGNIEKQFWAEEELAKKIFNISADELKNSAFKHYYGSLFSDAQYSDFDYEMIMVMYLYPPSVKDVDLTPEMRSDYFTKKLMQMYDAYKQQRTPRN